MASHHHDHAHHADHGHGHGHCHGPVDATRAFAVGVALNLAFVVAEVAFGIRADSLALLADAGHNFSDVVGLLFAWGAAALATRKPSARFTYGLRGSTILAALGNAMLLLFATGGIVWEAIRRLAEPTPVATTTVIWVAAAGVVVNLATALMFLRGRESDLNVRAAFLHMAADTLVSAGVIVAGALIQVGLHNTVIEVLSGVAILLASINIFGGFAVTRRMLSMFSKGA